ncbi:MAG TPA: glycosyltransferase family 39 protein [Blastocatellia bacterium]|nr:glycosyltransferase family 39 protein [Blastocatellia bacterium]
MNRTVWITVALLVAALGSRLFIATRLATDEPDDGRVYARIALNVLDHHGYSVETEEPYSPTYIRVPGYPLFLALTYKVLGLENNHAVRILQAVLDTLTCLLIGCLAWTWAPRSWTGRQRMRALNSGLALAIVCPFIGIYVATILTETLATLLITASVLAASVALRFLEERKRSLWWAVSGLFAGLATMVRPEAGLFGAGLGVVMVLVVASDWKTARLTGFQHVRRLFGTVAINAALLCTAFGVVLAPWTIRNARVFGVFQPIAPTRAGMPGDFIAYGYIRWLKTWVDDGRYVGPFEWALDERVIDVNQAPQHAFDSPEERAEVVRLFDQYNGPGASAQQSIKETAPPQQPKESGDDGEADPEDSDEQDEPDEEVAPPPDGLTPQLDEQFDKIAQARIARHPIRYYVVLPVRRAISMWFDTHSQYYPFDGSLFPLQSLDRDLHQQYWLPVFALGTWSFTLLGLAGCVVIFRRGEKRWLLMLCLLLAPRLILLSSFENPEPRYVIELFALLLAAGSLPVALLLERMARRVFPRSDSPA